MPLADAFTSPDRKRQHVRTLFTTIADRYDLITVLLSFGRDQAWKRRLVRLAAPAPGTRALDLACGTGDIGLALASHGVRVVGLDITPRMLALATRKRDAEPLAQVAAFVAGDMMALPIQTATMDLVTTGYGLRNVPELEGALGEIARVLRPGGRFLSLDFNRPQPAVIRMAYVGYLTVVGSALGWALHRDPDTYRYIPESLRRYPGATAIANRLRAHGFRDVEAHPVLGGLLTLHTAILEELPVNKG